MYAYAMIFWEVLSDTRLQQSESSSLMEVAMTMEGKRPQIPSGWDPEVKNLVTSCWHTSPLERPNFNTISEVMEGMISSKPMTISKVIQNT